MGRFTSRLTADERIAKYSPASVSSEDYEDEDYGEGYIARPAPARLTPAQRRRTIHKAQGAEHEELANPDRWLPAGHKQSYLSPSQFMPMSEVKQLPSVDAEGDTVAALIPQKRLQIQLGQGDTRDYSALREAMRKGGPAGREVPPLHIAPGPEIRRTYLGSDPYGRGEWMAHEPAILGNGGHRIALANELGWKMVPYTRHVTQSGWGDDRGFGKDFDEDSGDDYRYGGGSSTSDYTSNKTSTRQPTMTDNEVVGHPSLEPGGRSYVPGFTGVGDPGARWHAHGKNGARTRGLYTELHGPQTSQLNEQQFARTRMGQDPVHRMAAAMSNERKFQQDVIPGLNHYGSQYGDHEWSVGNASQPNWPGGGKIQHGDMFQSW